MLLIDAIPGGSIADALPTKQMPLLNLLPRELPRIPNQGERTSCTAGLIYSWNLMRRQ